MWCVTAWCQRIVKAYERYKRDRWRGRQLTLKLAEPDAAAPETAPGA